MSQIRIRELRLRNYRAFADVRLVLYDVTFLVGRNGADKSTLLDAFSFISEALTDSLGTALERRGNLEGVRRRQPGKGAKTDVSMAVVFEAGGKPGIYAFRLGSSPMFSNYVIKEERLEHGETKIVRDEESLRLSLPGATARSGDPSADWEHVASVVNDDLSEAYFESLMLPIF